MLSIFDYLVIVFYFVFMIVIGWIFRKFSKDTSDYFRGGGKILWWMIGSTAFMTQFSAWTFTGGAGKAYHDGFLILAIFFGNALGFFINYLWSSYRFRQMRVVTPVEAIRDRFGNFNEQFYTWLSIPVQVFYAGIWLYAVSTFVSSVFGIELFFSIMGVGLVVLFMSAYGGSWAVIASDFMQVLILMPLTIVAAFLALKAVGGVGEFFDKLPVNHIDFTNILRPEIVYLWIMAAFLKQVVNTNNINDAYRYVSAKDSKNARKAGLLASVLFLVGPVIWFIPPMCAAILLPDLSVVDSVSHLKKPADGAYVAIGLMTLPAGMIGLMVDRGIHPFEKDINLFCISRLKGLFKESCT